MRARRSALAFVVAMMAATTVGVSGAAAQPAQFGDHGSGSGGPAIAVPAAGTFYPVSPLRLLGTDTGYALAPGASVTVSPLGRFGLPSSGVSALMVNVTASAGAADAGVTLSPGGTAPVAPLVTAPAGTSRSVLLTIPLGATGGLDVAASGGAVGVTADLVGFYAADDTVIGSQGQSGGYQPVDVTRIFDTDGRGPVAPGARQVVSVDLGAAANSHTTAVLVRATAKNPAASGVLVVGGAAPVAAGTPVSTQISTVSFGAAADGSNLALVPAGGGSDRVDVTVTNLSAGATGIALDLVGFYDDGNLGPNLRFRPLPQTAVVDTRSHVGAGSLQPGRPVTVSATDAVATDSTFGLVGVVSATATTAGTLSLDSGDDPAPADLAVPIGSSSAAAQPGVGRSRTMGLTSTGSSPLDVRFDVTGSFEAYPPVTNPSARGWVSAVPGWQITSTVW